MAVIQAGEEKTMRIIFSLRAAIWQAITMDLAVSWKKAFLKKKIGSLLSLMAWEAENMVKLLPI